MSQKISYDEISSFKKDFKQLQKRYRTLADDLNTAKKHLLDPFHNQGIDSQAIIPLSGYNHENIQIYKVRKFACKALKNRGAQSGIRIIYAFQAKQQKLTFIEMYFKADQENEDRERIKTFLEN